MKVQSIHAVKGSIKTEKSLKLNRYEMDFYITVELNGHFFGETISLYTFTTTKTKGVADMNEDIMKLLIGKRINERNRKSISLADIEKSSLERLKLRIAIERQIEKEEAA